MREGQSVAVRSGGAMAEAMTSPRWRLSRLRSIWRMAVGAAVVVCGCSCSSPLDGMQTQDTLEQVAPNAVGLHADLLADLLRTSERDEHQDLHSILIARDGRLALEAYFNGAHRDDLHDIRSATKSITGTLVGIAMEEKRLRSLDLPVVHFFPEYRTQTSDTSWNKLTIRHLLEMRSGLDADDWTDNPRSAGTETRMEAAQDRLGFALRVPMTARPGERWQYSSVNTLLLGRIVSVATGQPLEAYAAERLFRPLGFGQYEWRRDAEGHVIPQGNLFLTARDLLKFGVLFEQGGRWQGRQLVPKSWIVEATQARTTLPSDPATGLGDLYKGYGYHWWTGSASGARRTIPYYFASGNGGQRVFVAPSERLVVVITSTAYNRGYAHRRAHAIFERVLAAIR